MFARRIIRNISPTTCILSVAAGLWLFQFQDKYIDDAYITLSYARTLAESGTWGTHPAALSNAATSPLSVILEAFLIRIDCDPVWSIWLINVTTTLLLAFAIKTINESLGAPGRLNDLLTTGLIATSPLIASTLGLETYLYGTLYTLAIACYLSERLKTCLAIISLLPLARPDGIAASAAMLFLLLRKRQSPIKPLCLFLLIPLLWLLFSWMHLGSFIPDTLFIKRSERAWNGVSFANGLLVYYKVYPLAILTSLAPIGLFSLFNIQNAKTSRPITLFLIAALLPAALVSIAYSTLGVPPYHWYYGLPVFMTALTASIGSLASHGWRRKVAIATHGLIISASGAISLDSLHTRDSVPITTNQGTASDYRRMASDVEKALNGKNFKLQGELGVIQFYSKGIAVNEFSDRRGISKLLSGIESASNPKRFLARLNFWHFKPPAVHPTDYTLSVWRSKCENPGFEVINQWKTHSPSNPKPDFDKLWCLLKAK